MAGQDKTTELTPIPTNGGGVPSVFQTRARALLDKAMGIDGAIKGTAQVYSREAEGLRIIAQRGFDDTFIATFEIVRADIGCSCSRALRYGRRVVIADITIDVLYEPYRKTALANGICAVQSTPVFEENGAVIGIISTHYPEIHHLSPAAEMALDALAVEMSRLIREHM